MPQHDLFGGWSAEHLYLHLHLPVNRPGGLVELRLADQHDRTQVARSVSWRKPRDTVGMPKVASAVVGAWIYAPVLDVAAELDRTVKLHLPPLPAHLA
jgi:hypothetical protein